jgi:dihydropyrimidinase
VRADVGIRGERIAAIGLDLAGAQTVDATGCWVIPGGVDPHVHLQLALGGRVSSDNFADGSRAALFGGTTTLIDFVDPQPGQGLLHALAARRQEADGAVFVDYGLHMTVPTWHAQDATALGEIPAALAAGCGTFKLYQAYARMMLDDVALLRVLQAVAAAGGRVVLHSETGPVLDLLREQALAQGHVAPIWHAKTRPARLEATAIARAAELADLAHCPLYIFHIGCREGLEALAQAAGRGISIAGETCPQYLYLTAEEHLGGREGALYVCAPPLRAEADQAALWAALAGGDLAVVSTDHCPWTRAEKQQADFTQIPGGVPGIELRLALVYQGVRRGLISPMRWVEVCCTAPAQWMGLARKGRLAPGYDADVVIFDPARRHVVAPATLQETAGWTPYAGMEIVGRPRTVLLRGEPVLIDEALTGHATGRFVPRQWGG